MALVDVDPFLTTLYVMVDDFCTASLPTESPPGPHAVLSRSAVLTLAIFGQGQECGCERGPRKLHRHHHRCYLAY